MCIEFQIFNLVVFLPTFEQINIFALLSISERKIRNWEKNSVANDISISFIKKTFDSVCHRRVCAFDSFAIFILINSVSEIFDTQTDNVMRYYHKKCKHLRYIQYQLLRHYALWSIGTTEKKVNYSCLKHLW